MSDTDNPLRVLVIDDEPEVCGLLAEALAQAGFQVVQANEVSQANELLAQQRFDCILTDLYLGRGDGGQVIAGVRLSRGANSKAPILLMSAHLEIEMLKKLRPMVNGVLVKPFNMATLLARINELVAPPAAPLAQAAKAA